MKIKPLISHLAENIQTYRANRFERLAKKHVQIHDSYSLKDDTLAKIYEAQTTLGNYARNNKVRVDIYSGDHILNELASGREEKAAANKLFVTVTDLPKKKTDKNKLWFLMTLPKPIYIQQKATEYMKQRMKYSLRVHTRKKIMKTHFYEIYTEQ